MFDKQIRASIKSARVKVTEEGAHPLRTIRLALEREFDHEIADALGEDAGTALEGLRSGGMTKVVLPIDAISASAVVDGQERIRLERIVGVKATASVGKAKEDADAPLKVKLEFDFPFQRDVWLMLGEEAGDVVGVTLTRRQLEIPGTERRHGKRPAADGAHEAPAKKGKGKKATAEADLVRNAREATEQAARERAARVDASDEDDTGVWKAGGRNGDDKMAF
jgi:hypothetical protein